MELEVVFTIYINDFINFITVQQLLLERLQIDLCCKQTHTEILCYLYQDTIKLILSYYNNQIRLCFVVPFIKPNIDLFWVTL